MPRLVRLVLLVAVASVTAHSAVIPVADESQLVGAIGSALPGDTIALTADIALTDTLIYDPADGVVLNGGGFAIFTAGPVVGISVQDCVDVVWRNVNVVRQAGAMNHVVSVAGFVDFNTLPYRRVHTVENMLFDNVSVSDGGSGMNAVLLEGAGNVVLRGCVLSGKRAVQISDLDFGLVRIEDSVLAASTRQAVLVEATSYGTGNGFVEIVRCSIASQSGDGLLFNWWGRDDGDPPANLDMLLACSEFAVAGKPVVFYTSGGTAVTSTKLGLAEINGNAFTAARDDLPLVLVDYVDGDLLNDAVQVCGNNVDADSGDQALFGIRGAGNPGAIVGGVCADACALGGSLVAVADTYVRRLASNTSEGASPDLSVTALGRHRSLIRFDQAEIEALVGAGTLVSATLELTVTGNGNNWGTTGRNVNLHRLTSVWEEGNGYVLGSPSPSRGTGSGATWDCAIDADISNTASDCSLSWSMLNGSAPFDANPAATLLVTNGLAGAVLLDVTADVAAFLEGTPNHGWIVRKEDELLSGNVTFSSREGSAPAVLVLVVQ
jgi:hypothetical protein